MQSFHCCHQKWLKSLLTTVSSVSLQPIRLPSSNWTWILPLEVILAMVPKPISSCSTLPPNRALLSTPPITAKHARTMGRRSMRTVSSDSSSWKLRIEDCVYGHAQEHYIATDIWLFLWWLVFCFLHDHFHIPIHVITICRNCIQYCLLLETF